MERFEKIYSQGALAVSEIWVDKETGFTIYFMQKAMRVA